MRNKITLSALLLLLLVNYSFADAHRGINSTSSAKEDGSLAFSDTHTVVPFVPSAVIDTSGRVPTMTNYYDYRTNGNNLRLLWVLGDTVIIASDMTDSINSGTSNARNSYYQVSYDKGITWQTDPLQVSSDGNAYPDLSPVLVSGSRTVSFAGRKFIGTVRGGYCGIDAAIAAGSITVNLINSTASDNFAQQMSATELGCGYQNKTNDSIFFAKYNFVTNTFSGTKTLDAIGVDASCRTFTAAKSDGKVAVGWWHSGDTVLAYKLSTDGGTTFGPKTAAVNPSSTVGGDQVSPWFGCDMLFGPAGNLCVAVNTLGPGNQGTSTGSKLVFYSPTINGGNPVVIADYHSPDCGMISDQTYYDNHYSPSFHQVGLTAISHPSLAFAEDNPNKIYCVFSVVQKDTSSYSYFLNDICESYSTNGGATWSNPVHLTNTPAVDEIYPSISKTGNTSNAIHVTYQLSECPGSHSFTNTATPICKVYNIYKKFDPTTGNVLPIGIANISNEVPAKFSLQQNYPNPFNPTTKIRFALPRASKVTVTVFNTLGQNVATLVNNEFVEAGTKEVTFDASTFASGVYFYSVKAGDLTETKKMILVK